MERIMTAVLMCPLLIHERSNQNELSPFIVDAESTEETARGIIDVSPPSGGVSTVQQMPEGYADGPAEGDMVVFPFRAITAAMMPGELIDFSHNDGKALKASVRMLDNATMFKDHKRSVSDWVGKVQRTWWSDGEKIQGKKAPPGIDVEGALDKVKEPDIVRGFHAGILKSVSVTLSFAWKKSHAKMTDDEFFDQMGQTVKDDVVRILPTKITKYFELSVVWEGADAYAKTLSKDDDDSFAPRLLKAAYQPDNGSQYNIARSEDGDFDVVRSAGNTGSPVILQRKKVDQSSRRGMTGHIVSKKNVKYKKGGNSMNTLLEQICSVLSFDESDDITPAALAEIVENFTKVNSEETASQIAAVEAQVTEVQGELETAQEGFKSLTEIHTALSDEHETLLVESEDLKQMAAVGDQYIADMRKDAIDSFRKIAALNVAGVDKTSTAAMSKQIETGGLDFVKACQQMYAAQLETAMPLACPKCGTKMARRSSKELPVDPTDGSRKQMHKVGIH